MPTLVEDWDLILKKAWSVKFQLIAGLCGALELVLPAYVDGMPRGWFALATIINAALGIGARVLAQKEITDVPKS